MNILPLNQKWKTSFYQPETTGNSVQTYFQSYKEVFQFDNTRDFLEMYQYLTKPSMLQAEQSYCIMKGDILPMFEDPALEKNGGRIRINVSLKNFDLVWDRLVLLVITGALTSNEFAGIECRKKNTDDMLCALWVNCPFADEDAIMEKLRKMLSLPENFNFMLQRPKK